MLTYKQWWPLLHRVHDDEAKIFVSVHFPPLQASKMTKQKFCFVIMVTIYHLRSWPGYIYALYCQAWYMHPWRKIISFASSLQSLYLIWSGPHTSITSLGFQSWKTLPQYFIQSDDVYCFKLWRKIKFLLNLNGPYLSIQTQAGMYCLHLLAGWRSKKMLRHHGHYVLIHRHASCRPQVSASCSCLGSTTSHCTLP